MSNGIFEVRFKSNRPDSGGGLVVIKDGSVNGGDANYLYQGNVPTESGKFSGQFKVSMWKPGNTNVTGHDNYTLDATGEINYESGTISLTGTVVGDSRMRVELAGNRIISAV
ncbi:GrlR family regulatory protein [Pseudomonas atacamensis]|jgi:hypothetical protein|uniref:GrlR family regulatory protein n=1 Tax=Pseudomonas atacamensis TaxID=2565368 RepID=UPI000A55900A